MSKVDYAEPRPARVNDQKFQRYAGVLSGMGLGKPEFLATGEKDGNIVVDPNDLSRSDREPFTLRRDIVEFL